MEFKTWLWMGVRSVIFKDKLLSIEEEDVEQENQHQRWFGEVNGRAHRARRPTF